MNSKRTTEVSASGTLQVVERPVTEPGTGQVRIRVEACGICHTDAATVTGTYPGLSIGKMNVVFLPGRSGNFGTGVMESESEREDSIFRGAGRFSGAQIENNSHRQSLQWQSGRGPDANRSVRNEQLHGGGLGNTMALVDGTGSIQTHAGFFGAIHS